MTDLLWWGVSGAGIVYVALFVAARTPASFRLGRVGWMALAVLVVRTGLLGLGHRLESTFDVSMVVVTTVATVGCRMGARVWLVRATREELNEEIHTACRGLFLGCQELQPGHFRLLARNSTRALKVAKLARRLQLVVLPAGIGERKVMLLVSWFAKQHPGPVPRLRIDLTRRSS